MRLGSEYGGWVICAPLLSPGDIVYSFGIGDDVSFDLELIRRFDVDVFAFDPTPRSIEWVKEQHLPDSFHFFDFGIGEVDGLTRFYPPENPDHISHRVVPLSHTADRSIEVPLKRLATIVELLGHTSRPIDLLKMDIEGAEYAVVADLIDSGLRPVQLLVEFHHRFERLNSQMTYDVLEKLHRIGYRIFAVSSNRQEYSLIDLSSPKLERLREAGDVWLDDRS